MRPSPLLYGTLYTCNAATVVRDSTDGGIRSAEGRKIDVRNLANSMRERSLLLLKAINLESVAFISLIMHRPATLFVAVRITGPE
jgi:hypothetical protein